MAWQDPSEASAYSTGFGALPPPPSVGGSSTVNAWVGVRTSTSVTPVSVPWVLNSAWPAAGSSITALRVSAMTVLSVTVPPRYVRRTTLYNLDLNCQEILWPEALAQSDEPARRRRAGSRPSRYIRS